MTHSRAPWPQHQCDRLRELYAAGKTDAEIAEALGRPLRGIRSKRHSMGLVQPVVKREKPAPKPSGGQVARMPDDFRTLGPTMTNMAAAAHYQRSPRVVRRWYAEAGIRPALKTGRPFVLFPMHKGHQRVEMEQSVPSHAAHYLRRFHANVHRADLIMFERDRTTWGDVNGLPDHGRGLYVVSGIGVVDADHLVELAAAKGWAGC